MTRMISVLVVVLSALTIRAQELPIYKDASRPAHERVENLIALMTLEEKIDLLAGYKDFYLHPCQRLGIPPFKLADGPLGLSSWGLFGRATAFPSALSLAASWNRGLAGELGEAYAQEWRARGIHFLLAPGANIYRASKGARNFEYFGEDPYLTSEMVVPFIRSVQDGGVIATIKHFAVNDQEFDRYTVSSEIDERTLREIYLPPFKAAVEKAGVKAVMTGYNPVNGVYCTENKYLIDILKKEWKFNGILMSDWACTHSAVNAATAGLDLEMGSKSWYNREKLIPLIESGELSLELIDDKVRRIYGTCIEMGFFDRPQKIDSIPVFNQQINHKAYEVAKEGVILLKNTGDILPLKQPKTIAIIGPTANPAVVNDRVFNVNGIVYGGGGSSKVHPWYVVSDLQGIINEFPESRILYDEGIANRFKPALFRKGGFYTKDGKRGLQASYYNVAESDTDNNSALLQEQAKAAGRNPSDIKTQSRRLSTKDNLVLEQIDQNVNFEWWGKPHGNSSFMSEYKVCWQGYVEAEKSDDLIFFVDAQGGYRLWLNGVLSLDAGESQSFDVRNIRIPVQKGDKVDLKLEFYNQLATPAEIRMGYTYDSDIDFSESLKIAQQADVVLFYAGLDGSIELEGRDRPFDLPFGQDSLIRLVAHANPNTIVVLHAGGGVNMAPWINDVKGVIHALYAGQEGGRAVAEVISGKVNPSAKLPFTIEKRWSDSPAAGNYDETRKEKKVYYKEGIFAGYRGYENRAIEPLFPFGFGLSYSTFEYANLTVNKKERYTFDVSFDITNSSNRDGQEVFQVYVRDVKSREVRPWKELKGFDKYPIKAGETKKITILLENGAFEYFSDKDKRWTLEKGDFEIMVGASSNDIRLRETITIK